MVNSPLFFSYERLMPVVSHTGIVCKNLTTTKTSYEFLIYNISVYPLQCGKERKWVIGNRLWVMGKEERKKRVIGNGL